jgi:mRNA interferase MazF
VARTFPARGEIWLVDLGIAQKTRPVAILSLRPEGDERIVVTYVARTTSLRGTRFEVPHRDRGFAPGVFDAQSVGTIPVARLVKRIGRLDSVTMGAVEDSLRRWLQL